MIRRETFVNIAWGTAIGSALVGAFGEAVSLTGLNLYLQGGGATDASAETIRNWLLASTTLLAVGGTALLGLRRHENPKAAPTEMIDTNATQAE